MKLIGRLIKLGILILVLLLVFHNFTAKTILTLALRLGLGVPTKIESARIDFLNTWCLFRGIEVRNPYGFPDGLLARIPKIFVDLEISSLWEGRLHFSAIEIDFDELRVVRLADGRVNLLTLTDQDATGRRRESPSAKPPQFQIDEFVLSLGRATYMDLTGPVPIVKNYNLNIREAVYRDINGAEDIVKIISWQTLKRMGLGQVMGAVDQIGKELGLSGSGPGAFFEKAVAAIKEKL